MGLDAVEHRERVVLGGRREAEGDVLENFDQHAAEAERHQLAERAVGDGTDDDFGAASEHLLDLDAFDLGVSLILLGVRQNGVVGPLGVFGGLDADHHAAGFGLVEDVRRDDFHHDREAHGGCDLRRLGRRLGDPFFGNRDPVSVANQLAFGRRQTRALIRLDCIQDFADRIFGIRH